MQEDETLTSDVFHRFKLDHIIQLLRQTLYISMLLQALRKPVRSMRREKLKMIVLEVIIP